MRTIQITNSPPRTVKNTGLFLGLEDEKENLDTVLEYKNSRLASPPNSPGAKLVRSTTFDEMLRSPSSEGQFTPPSTVVSKEEVAEKHAETEIQAPTPRVPVGSTPIEQKIPFLVPSEDETGGVSGRTTPDPMASPEVRAPVAEEKQGVGTKGDISEKKAKTDAFEGMEGTGSKEMAGEIKASKGKGKAREIASDAEPDDIDLLLKEWTTLHE